MCAVVRQLWAELNVEEYARSEDRVMQVMLRACNGSTRCCFSLAPSQWPFFDGDS